MRCSHCETHEWNIGARSPEDAHVVRGARKETANSAAVFHIEARVCTCWWSVVLVVEHWPNQIIDFHHLCYIHARLAPTRRSDN